MRTRSPVLRLAHPRSTTADLAAVGLAVAASPAVITALAVVDLVAVGSVVAVITIIDLQSTAFGNHHAVLKVSWVPLCFS